MFYDSTAHTEGFVIRNNLFSRSEDTVFRLFNDMLESLVFYGNEWVAGRGTLCRFHGRPTKNLLYHYPDRLDQMHDDNLAEIESQTVARPRVFASWQIAEFKRFINSR